MRRLGAGILLLALACPAAAAEGLVLTGDLQLSVGEAFLAAGENYRAVTEFRRFLILFPGSPRADEALLGIGIAYERGEEHAAAARAFAEVRDLAPGSPRAAEAQLREGVSWWRAGEAGRARKALEAVRTNSAGVPEAERATEALALMAVEEGDLAGAAAQVDALRREGDGRQRRAAELLAAAGEVREKSPALAGALSAVLPGSGYLTVGRPGDAVTALAINALFAAGAVTAWRQENYPLAALVTGVWIPFYAGNIQGSANAARRWNVGLRTDLRTRLAAALEFSY